MKYSKYLALAYFDIFDFPLTELELDTWQWNDSSSEKESPPSQSTQGFYCLPGRTDIIFSRKQNFAVSLDKLRQARKFVQWFSFLPSVRAVFVCNSLGYMNANADSDIDFLIITKKSQLWITRFYLQGFLKILKRRPFDKNKKKDGICLSFFLSEDSLNIENLRLQQGPDIYLHYWLAQLLPIYDPAGLYHKLLKENNWLKNHLPHYLPVQLPSQLVLKKNKWSLFFSFLCWQGLEKIVKKWQIKKMPKELKNLANQDTRVVLSDQIIKLHGSGDRRRQYQQAWQRNIQTQ